MSIIQWKKLWKLILSSQLIYLAVEILFHSSSPLLFPLVFLALLQGQRVYCTHVLTTKTTQKIPMSIKGTHTRVKLNQLLTLARLTEVGTHNTLTSCNGMVGDIVVG